jgi:transcriptional regulator with XRE-family HTH domain
MQRFGEKLQELRKRKHMTQEELGATFGFTRTFVSEMERGLKLPSVKLLIRIADLFEVTLDQLARDELDV